MFLGIYGIDEYVAIPAITHRFSSGAAYAPTAITYSIYEEGNTTGLDEDVDMTPASPFDSVVGFYYARRQLTAAAGFENNKTYVVLIKATVDSISAIETHVFQVRPQQTGDSYAIVNSGTNGNAALKTLLDTTGIKVATNSDKTGYGLADDAITSAKFDESTAYPLKSADTGATAVARTGADSDTLETLSDQMDAIVADTNELQTDLVNGGRLDLLIDGIKAKTDNLPADPADDSDIDGQLATITTHLTDIKGTTFVKDTTSLPQCLTATGFSTLDAAGVRTAVGLVSANLDTQLGDIPTNSELASAVANVSVDEIQVSALADLFNTNSGTTYSSAVSGSLVKEIADNAGGSALTESGIADAVWDELLSGHTGVGSTGAGLSAAGSAGDPWSTTLPGSYGSGTAGKIIGDNINATISSRSSHSASDVVTAIGTGSTLTAVPWNALWDAEVQSECTDALNAYDPPTKTEMDSAFTTTNGKIDAVDDYVDSEVAAIKTVTDKLDTAVELDGAVYRFTTNALEQAPTGGSAPSAATIADAVWDEAIADHTTSSTFGGKNQKAVPSETVGDYKATGFSTFNPVTDTVARVTLVDTCTTNTDMRGTDSAALASTALSNATWTDAKAGYIDAAISTIGGGSLTAADIRSEIDTNSTKLASILEDTGTTLPAQISGISTGGTGSTSQEIEISVDSVPQDNAKVWVTTDSAGANIIRSGYTNSFGKITFQLDSGTYYVWAEKDGINIDNPSTLTVT